MAHTHDVDAATGDRRDHLDGDDPWSAMRVSGGQTVRYAGVVANITGNPAMSVPLWWNGDGLPIGVHFLGRYGDEATLIRLAAQLEHAQPWAHRLPTVHAARTHSADHRAPDGVRPTQRFGSSRESLGP